MAQAPSKTALAAASRPVVWMFFIEAVLLVIAQSRAVEC